MTAMDASRRAMIFEITRIPPFPSALIILEAALKETHTIRRFTTKEATVGIIP